MARAGFSDLRQAAWAAPDAPPLGALCFFCPSIDDASCLARQAHGADGCPWRLFN